MFTDQLDTLHQNTNMNTSITRNNLTMTIPLSDSRKLVMTVIVMNDIMNLVTTIIVMNDVVNSVTIVIVTNDSTNSAIIVVVVSNTVILVLRATNADQMRMNLNLEIVVKLIKHITDNRTMDTACNSNNSYGPV